jgi:hypothetical protein
MSIVVAAASGCAEMEMEMDMDMDTDMGTSALTLCREWGCGGNSAVLNGYPVDELDLHGQWSRQGFRITGFADSRGTPVTVEIHGGLLHVGYPGQPSIPFDQAGNTSLAGLRILVDKDTGEAIAPVEHHAIHVMRHVDGVSSWADPETSVPAYVLRYHDTARDTLESLCPESGGEQITHAILVAGERYDEATKSVWASGDSAEGWFNIACAGSALAKMALMGYGPETPMHGIVTTPMQRQATLKMLTADYCGTGTSYTVSGQPLEWQNRYGWFAPEISGGSLEAIWTESGALCLDNPRRPDLWDDACSLPTCDSVAASQGEWRTTTPPELM